MGVHVGADEFRKCFSRSLRVANRNGWESSSINEHRSLLQNCGIIDMEIELPNGSKCLTFFFF